MSKTANQIKMIVEIPKLSSNKYEYDIVSKVWELDRVLAGAMFYPEEYGFIPETLDYDGDPLDVICLNNYPTFPGCYLPIRIVGVLKMVDGGEEDDKLLAVNAGDPRWEKVNYLSDVGQGKLDEIKHFFLHYKDLENKKVELKGFQNKEEAKKVLEKCQKLYKKYGELINKGITKKELVKALKKNKVN